MLCSDPGVTHLGPSGASVHLRAIARAFHRQGVDVRIAAPKLDDARGAVPTGLDGVGAFLFPPRQWIRGLRTLGRRWDAIALAQASLGRDWRPDLVWERHSLCDAGGHWLQRRLGVPRIVEINAPLTLERSWLADRVPRPRDVRQELRWLRDATRVIAVSDWLGRWLVEQGVPQGVVRVVPNGTEAITPGRRARTRARLGVDGPLVGFVGSAKRWHGLARFPDWLDALGPDWTGVVIGDGPAMPAPHPRLKLVGRVPPAAVRHYVSALDVGIAPLAPDAPDWFCPLKVLDYLAQGVPTVVADRAHVAYPTAVEQLPADAPPRAWADAILRAAARDRTPMLRTWDRVLEQALAPTGPNEHATLGSGLAEDPDMGHHPTLP